MEDPSSNRREAGEELDRLRQRIKDLEARAIEHERMEKDLRESEARFRSLYESVHAGVLVQAVDGTITHVNQIACTIFSMTAEEIQAMTSLDPVWQMVTEEGEAVAGEDHPSMITLRTGQPVRDAVRGVFATHPMELRWLLINTKPRFSAASGDLIEVITTFQDITNRKNFELALSESEEKYRQLFELVSDAIFLVDNDTGRILEVNSTASAMYGYDRQELLQMRNVDLSAEPSETREATIAQRTRIPTRYHHRKDGVVIPVEIAASHYSWSGRPVHIAAIRDISDRIRTEESLRQANAEFQERNDELDAFADTVAHDLKSPLAVINGYAELLRDTLVTSSDTTLVECLGHIVSNLDKMNNIVDELLLLAEVRKEDVRVEPLNMADVVAEALQRIQYLVDEYVGEISTPDEWPPAIGYAPWVTEVWVNYLTNALKYGGRPPRVSLGAEPGKGATVRFWVRDNGPGLSPQEQSQLFAPFTRLDRIRCERAWFGVVHRAPDRGKVGGKVDLASEVGAGSTFSFTLPTVQPGRSLHE